MTDLYTWIDAVYAVHNNMRGHTGGAISLGYGIMHGKASKQKLNVKISTESEFVGMGEYFPYNIWFIMFMGVQGYAIKNNVIYQDNKRAILSFTKKYLICMCLEFPVHEFRPFFSIRIAL